MKTNSSKNTNENNPLDIECNLELTNTHNVKSKWIKIYFESGDTFNFITGKLCGISKNHSDEKKTLKLECICGKTHYVLCDKIIYWTFQEEYLYNI